MRCITLLLFAFVLSFLACSSPKPPTLQVQGGQVVDSDPAGVIIRVSCLAHNPNGFPLPIHNVTGTMKFDSQDVDNVVSSSSATLAPNADTPVTIDVKTTWASMASAASRTGNPSQVNYTVQGTASLGEDGKVKVPFTYSGQIDKKFLLLGALRHLGVPKRPAGGLPTPPNMSYSSE